MKRTVKRVLLALSLTTCLAVAGLGLAACDGTIFPDYKLTGGGGSQDGTASKYTIKTLSVGGIKLPGVSVTVKKDGETVKRGISDANGVASFSLSEGVYELEYENLPAGYYADSATVAVTPSVYGTIEARFPSKIITSQADPGNAYYVGNVMYDFRFKDSLGNDYLLSDLLDQENPSAKKAVVLNFWYSTCNPCKAEIPFMEQAYQEYKSKVEMLAISDRDNAAAIEKFKASMAATASNPVRINFPMGYDEIGLVNRFNVTAFPTTIVIDRYGTIVARHEGSMPSLSSWRSLFEQYSSNDYTQEVDPDNGSGELVRVKPDATTLSKTPDYTSDDFKEMLCLNNEDRFSFHNEENADDKIYNWPWLYGENNASLEASNKNTNYSYANFYSIVQIGVDEVLSFDYFISINENTDALYVIVNRKLALELSGKSTDVAGNVDGWVTQPVLTSNREQTLEVAFCYLRSEASPDASEAYTNTVRIRNMSITAATATDKPVDMLRDAAIYNESSKTFTYKPIALWPKEEGGDGYYHVMSDDGTERLSILYMDVSNETNWSYINGGITFEAEGANYPNSLYYNSYWKFSNYLEADANSNPLLLYPGHPTESNEIIQQFIMQGFSDNGYVPVSPALKAAAECFLEIARSKNLCRDEGSNQWLQFCYYFQHYDGAHGATHDDCATTTDPVSGMNHYNALTAYAGVSGAPAVNHVNVYRGKNNDSAVRYRFTPVNSGTYHIYTQIDPSKDSITDPAMYIIKWDDYSKTYKYVYEETASLRYDRFRDGVKVEDFTYYKYGNNIDLYYHFDANETAYLYMMLNGHAQGAYDFYIEEVTDPVEAERQLLVCTTGEGEHSDDLIGSGVKYISINIAYDTASGYWYPLVNGEPGRDPIYINFVDANFCDTNGHSVYEFIKNNQFFFNASHNYTELMMKYYLKSVNAYVEADGITAKAADSITGEKVVLCEDARKPFHATRNPAVTDTHGNPYYIDASKVDSELFGMAPADQVLASILDILTSAAYEQPTDTKCWLSLACYYRYMDECDDFHGVYNVNLDPTV